MARCLACFLEEDHAHLGIDQEGMIPRWASLKEIIERATAMGLSVYSVR